MKEFAQRIRRTDALVDELSQWWLRLVAILYLTRSWPLSADRESGGGNCSRLGQGSEEIRDVLSGLARWSGRYPDGRVTGFNPGRAWEVSSTHIY